MPNADEKKILKQHTEVLKESASDVLFAPAASEEVFPDAMSEMPPVFMTDPPAAVMKKKSPWSFDFVSLLQYHERIAGLVVGEDAVRFMLYTHASGNDFIVDTYKEEALDQGVISEGILMQPNALAGSLRTLLRQIHAKGVSSVILSLPPESTWLTRIEFPPHLKAEDVQDAIHLFEEFSLPFTKEDVYTDSEFIVTPERNDIRNVVLGAAKKSIINSYLQALSGLDISAIAVENHLISVERAIRSLQLENLLAVIVYPGSVSLGAFSKSCFRFQRSVPWKRMVASNEAPSSVPYAELCEEIKKFLHFLKTDDHDPITITDVFLVAHDDVVKQFESCAGPEIPVWHGDASLLGEDFKDNRMGLIAKGAALRGIVPRKDDAYISLTPIGTEQIYERKRAVSFSSFFARLTIGIGLFFILLYAGSYLLISQLARNVESRQLLQSSVSTDAAHIQEEVITFNQEVGKLNDLARRLPRFDRALESIAQLSNPGISVSTISINDPASGAVITGSAKNKDSLLQFKAALNSSAMFKPVEIPFASLLAKGDIPFRFSLVFEKKDFLFEK